MNKNILELVFILDRSGSMHGLERDTVGGFNSMIEKQKSVEGEVLVSTVLFNTKTTVLHDRKPITEIEKMKIKDFETCGCTALLDAIGSSINHISNIHKYIRKEDVPNKVMFVITTDGFENASNVFTSKQIKELIKEKQEKDKWEFLFIGANIDAVETANLYGIDELNAVNYHADKKGTKVLYDSVSETVLNMRTTGKLNKKWRETIDKDFMSRKNND